MNWNAFIMARNEEKLIGEAISCIKNQTIPPKTIYVVDDGSTDATGKLLDDMGGITITHLAPHQSGHYTQSYVQKRTKLMYDAAAGSDYVLNLDADIYIPSNYVERITQRMQTDDVVVSCGMDKNEYMVIPIEPGMVINVDWLHSHNMQLSFEGKLGIQSVIDGHPVVVYRDIPLSHRRRLTANYSRVEQRRAGEARRKLGVYPLNALYRSVRYRSLASFWGFVSYRGDMDPKPLRSWYKKYQVERFKMKLGLDSRMFKETDRGLFILPDDERSK